jgi:hypothetical protein
MGHHVLMTLLQRYSQGSEAILAKKRKDVLP